MFEKDCFECQWAKTHKETVPSANYSPKFTELMRYIEHHHSNPEEISSVEVLESLGGNLVMSDLRLGFKYQAVDPKLFLQALKFHWHPFSNFERTLLTATVKRLQPNETLELLLALGIAPRATQEYFTGSEGVRRMREAIILYNKRSLSLPIEWVLELA